MTLPSGKRLEVLEEAGASGLPAGAEPVDSTARGAERAPATEAHVCADCASPLVYPVAWHAADHEHWHVDLRCPNCERVVSAVLDQETAERFDEELERGAETLISDLARLSEANMVEDIERFVAALDVDAIQPSDF